MEFENRFDDGQPEVVDQAEETQTDAGQAGVVDQQEGGEPKAEEKKPQTKTENAAIKAARVRAQHEAEARMRQQFDDEIASSGAINPYTGEPFHSFQEFRAYGQRYQKEQLEEQSKATGRSVQELEEEAKNRAYLSKKRKEEEGKKARNSKQQEEQMRLLADALVFQGKYPGADIGQLERDKKFRKFCGNRLYKEPITNLYEDYLELVSDAQETGKAKAAGKQQRGTGGGTGGQGVTLTAAQQRELDAWNREFPEMKMTAKEFAARG